MNSLNDTLDRDELLRESFNLFQWSLSRQGKYAINERIVGKLDYLKKVHRLQRDDVLADLFTNFLSKKHYQKYDSSRSQLSTFIVNYTNWRLLDLIKKYETLAENYSEVPLYDEHSYQVKGSGCSLSYLEDRGHELVIDKITPEDSYNGKMLWELAADFFGKENLLVLLGIKDKRTEAKRLSMKYHSYRKQLQRKVAAFKSFIKELGYL